MRIQMGKHNRAQHLSGPAPQTVSTEEQIYSLSCVHCGANMTRDTEFQAFHMLKMHGIEV